VRERRLLAVKLLTVLAWLVTFLKLKLNYDRQSVGQSVLVSGTHLGRATNFSLSLKFSLGILRVRYFVAPSLTRGRVCNLLLLVGLARAIPLGSESRGTQDHILLSQFLRLPLQSWGPGPCIYIPQEEGAPDMHPVTGFPFRRLLRLSGLRWRYSHPPPHGKVTCLFCVLLKVKGRLI
jgi:hypothetical protein